MFLHYRHCFKLRVNKSNWQAWFVQLWLILANQVFASINFCGQWMLCHACAWWNYFNNVHDMMIWIFPALPLRWISSYYLRLITLQNDLSVVMVTGLVSESASISSSLVDTWTSWMFSFAIWSETKWLLRSMCFDLLVAWPVLASIMQAWLSWWIAVGLLCGMCCSDSRVMRLTKWRWLGCSSGPPHPTKHPSLWVGQNPPGLPGVLPMPPVWLGNSWRCHAPMNRQAKAVWIL